MDFLQDFSSVFGIVKRSLFKNKVEIYYGRRHRSDYRRKETGKSNSAPDTRAEGAKAEGAKAFRNRAAKGE